jgi:hypothetical protein
MQTWEPPAFTEIKMDSEIGAYQEEYEERVPEPSSAVERSFPPAAR